MHVIPNVMRFGGDYNSFEYYSTDALYSKTTTPIPRGGKVVGILWFLFIDVKEEAVDHRTVALHARDIMGTDITINLLPPEEMVHNTPLFYPGTRLGVPKA